MNGYQPTENTATDCARGVEELGWQSPCTWWILYFFYLFLLIHLSGGVRIVRYIYTDQSTDIFLGRGFPPTVGCHITSNIQVAVQNFRVQLTWLEKEQYITGILVVLNSLFVEIHARQPDYSDLSSDIIVTSFPRRKKKGYRPNLTFNAIDNFTAHGPPAGPPVPLNSTHLTGRGHFCKWEFYRNQESHTRK
jgi:hypothetical protein